MVLVVATNLSFCIDKTEVTRAAYDAFVASGPPLPQLDPPDLCDWNKTFDPYVGETDPMLPVQGVNWCDAYAFCKSVKKRICGGDHGADVAFKDHRNSKDDEWYVACSLDGTRDYPYAKVGPDLSACADCDPGVGCMSKTATPSLVGTHPGCEGGYKGLLDMSGSVFEWESSCLLNGFIDAGPDVQGPRDPQSDSCSRRGGSYDEPGANGTPECLGCLVGACAVTSKKRNDHSTTSGIRCCADPQ
jgi:formylglycine-generating enzyme required for sulfatase activity